MAEQVERVGVGLAGVLGELFEGNPVVLERGEDGRALIGVAPPRPQRRRRGDDRPDLFGGVVGVLDHAQLFARGVQFIHDVGGNVDFPAIDVELPDDPLGRLDDPRLGRSCPVVIGRRPGIGDRVVDWSHDRRLDRIAVKIVVGEQPRGAPGVIEDREPELAVVRPHARAAPNDLLELDHGVHHPRDGDVPARRDIDARGQELRGRHDDRRGALDVLELAQVPAPDVALVSYHANHVVGMLADEIRAEVVDLRAHLVRVLLVHTEHDGLGKPIGPGEEIDDASRDGSRSGAQGDDPLEIRGEILLVGDRVPVAVALVLRRAPAGGVNVAHDAMHPVRSEKPVVDPLAQAVAVDRRTEILVRVAILDAERRGGHAPLVREMEMREDLAPVAFLRRAAPVALVHDDQIEESGVVLPVQPRPGLISRDGLVGREVHLPALDRFALDLVASVAERRELLVLRIVDQHGAV